MIQRPSQYLIRIAIFLVAVLVLAGFLNAALLNAFMANPALNGLILGVLLIGLGKAKDLDDQVWQNAGGAAYAGLANTGLSVVNVLVDGIDGSKVKDGDAAANLAYGANLRSYRFDKYKTQLKDDTKPSVKFMKVLSHATAAARKAYAPLAKIADGVVMTRDLVSEPPNVLYPESLANRCKELTKLGVKVQILGEAQMRRLGMGALLGVGQGSIRESKMVVMQWNGGVAKDKPVAFVGKGVTFDTGGISLKPGAGMEDMKWDMGGSGVVIGLMKALAGRSSIFMGIARNSRTSRHGTMNMADGSSLSRASHPSHTR